MELVEVGGFNRKRSGGIVVKKLPDRIRDKAAKRLDIQIKLTLHLLSSFVYVRLNFVARLLYLALVTAGCAERAPYDLNWLDTV